MSRGAGGAPAPQELVILALGGLLALHHAWLLDDAYVYLRYVDNWVLAGRGLVYNPGEWVEGFTSPAWVVLLGLLRALGLDYWLAIRGVAVAACLGSGLLLMRLERRLAPPAAPRVSVTLALLLPNYAVLCYFSSGTESPLALLLAPAYALYLVGPPSRSLDLAVALGPLVRPELALAAALAMAFRAATDRRLPWRTLALAAAFGGGWLLLRIRFYAELLPNPYYLKGGSDWSQGLLYWVDAVWPYGWPLGALVAVGLAWALARRGRLIHERPRLAMLGIALAVALYVAKVGGDARHFRYLAFSYALATCAAAGLAEAALKGRSRGLAAAVGAALALLTLWLHPQQLDGPRLWRTPETRMVWGIADAEQHRQHVQLPDLDPWSSGSAIDRRSEYRAVRGVEGHSAGYICWAHYAQPGRRALHRLGLTDPFLARVTLPADRPGHKWGLIGLARDMERIERWWGRPPAPGMYRAAVEAGRAPAWVAENLAVIERIERRVYNDGRWLENLRLALEPAGRIRPPPSRRDAAPVRPAPDTHPEGAAG